MEQKILTITSDDGFLASLEKALTDIDPKWFTYRGLLLTGTHAPEKINMEWAMEQIREARQNRLPILGICFGLHLGVIEFARNVLGLPEAMTTELKKDTSTPIIDALPGMRVGIRPVFGAQENHWHQYKVNMQYAQQLNQYFTIAYTKDGDDQEIVEYMKLEGHPFCVFTQYHPEYNSKPDSPHPVLVGFIEACKKATI